MRAIEFVNINNKAGYLDFSFCETINDKQRNDTAYVEFDPIKVNDDTIAYMFASFCGTVYDRVYMDLAITEDTFVKLKKYLRADYSVREVKRLTLCPPPKKKQLKISVN